MMADEKKPLSIAQRRQLERLVIALNRAQSAVESAQAAADTAQRTANDFLGYCAEELAVPIGTDGWQFDQAQMAFVKKESE